MSRETTRSGLKKLEIAARPSILFATAFALTTTPHEAAHAVTAYLLGFNLTLFKMWVNPDAASATPAQSFAIAVAGPAFSLVLGSACWLSYRRRFNESPVGLLFLMLAVVSIYSFLGPMAAVAFGGEFNVAFQAASIPKPISYAVSAIGLVLLSAFMIFMGRELLKWARIGDSRVKSIVMMTVAPWMFGMLLVLLIYRPLPKFIIGPNLAGSIFWLFAVAGAISVKGSPHRVYAGSPPTLLDWSTTLVAICMVWSVGHGIRLAH
jgi:hypothetical protein